MWPCRAHVRTSTPHAGMAMPGELRGPDAQRTASAAAHSHREHSPWGGQTSQYSVLYGRTYLHEFETLPTGVRSSIGRNSNVVLIGETTIMSALDKAKNAVEDAAGKAK